MWMTRVAVLICVFITGGYCASDDDLKGLNFVTRTLSQCIRSNERYSCISERVARAIERSMNWDITLLDGMTLVRNNESINHRQARLLGFDRLSQAVQNFFQTHVISLELGGARQLGSGRKGSHDEDDEDSFGGGFDQKQLQKEKKYMQYAFMVLLGIFGLTGPLVMKVLGLMAAHSLVAAKAALIIVGSVALKKLFEKDRQEPTVQVHTINNDEEEYERVGKYGMDSYDRNYNSGFYYNNPYRSYYDGYYTVKKNKF